MSRIVITHVIAPGDLPPLLEPRQDVVRERLVSDGRYEAVDGPFAHYERTVETAPAADGQLGVTEVIDFRLAIPVWKFIFELPYRSALRRRKGTPWWAPPQRLDARAATVLGLLCAFWVVAGYLGTLITQTITFASDEFGTGRTAQGVTLAGVRAGVVVTILVATLADRRGRRQLLTVAAIAACVITATGAIAPSLPFLGVSQAFARGFGGSLTLLIAIVCAEEMPEGSRAYAYSLIVMSQALGAGVCLWVLPVADLGEPAWRVLYLVPLAFVPAALAIHRRLPESRRFVVPHRDVTMAGHGRRFWLLAGGGFLLAVFAAPASQFQNEFLKDELGFSAARISLYTVVTATPAAIGIVLGGRLADVRGRRVVGAIGVAGGALFSAAQFSSQGWSLWAITIAGSIVGGLVVPVVNVYRPELFPTSLRGRAGGIVEAIALTGSATGLLLAGYLSDRWGEFGTPLALLAIGPILLAVLILVAYPETAKRTLEELNPEDPAVSDGISGAPSPSG